MNGIYFITLSGPKSDKYREFKKCVAKRIMPFSWRKQARPDLVIIFEDDYSSITFLDTPFSKKQISEKLSDYFKQVSFIK